MVCSHLCMAASRQSLAAPLTAQTRSVPVFSQRCHLLSCGIRRAHVNNRLSSSRAPTFSLTAERKSLPKYTFLLHLGHRLASPEKVVMLPAAAIQHTFYTTAAERNQADGGLKGFLLRYKMKINVERKRAKHLSVIYTFHGKLVAFISNTSLIHS